MLVVTVLLLIELSKNGSVDIRRLSDNRTSRAGGEISDAGEGEAGSKHPGPDHGMTEVTISLLKALAEVLGSGGDNLNQIERLGEAKRHLQD
jgi:hypothetical protein